MEASRIVEKMMSGTPISCINNGKVECGYVDRITKHSVYFKEYTGSVSFADTFENSDYAYEELYKRIIEREHNEIKAARQSIERYQRLLIRLRIVMKKKEAQNEQAKTNQ